MGGADPGNSLLGPATSACPQKEALMPEHGVRRSSCPLLWASGTQQTLRADLPSLPNPKLPLRLGLASGGGQSWGAWGALVHLEASSPSSYRCHLCWWPCVGVHVYAGKPKSREATRPPGGSEPSHQLLILQTRPRGLQNQKTKKKKKKMTF